MIYEQSPRAISIETAAKITRELPPFVTKVGIFVDPTIELVRGTVERAELQAVQLHGNETPEFCHQLRTGVIKAFRIEGPESLEPMRRYRTSAWLLDSFVAGKAGGTGAKFNWDLAVRAKGWGPPILLAGGLTPENVGAAV